MKRWLKLTLIVLGVLIVINIIIEATKSPEQRAKEERARYVKDSLERSYRDSIDLAGIGVSFSEATKGMGSARWEVTGVGRLFKGSGIKILLRGDTSNLAAVATYIDPSTNADAKLVILKTLMVNVVGEANAGKILSDIGASMQGKKPSSTWTIGEKMKLEYAFDNATSELLVTIVRPSASDARK